MTDTEEPRLFADDAAVAHIGEGLIACTLTRPEWTHEAHLAACAYLLVARPDIVPERDLPGLIRRFNESVGGTNSDSEGYHETITQVYIRAVRGFLARTDAPLPLVDKVNALLKAPEGRRDWPLRFYSRERLFSKAARLGWVEPDLAPFPPDGSAAPTCSSDRAARLRGAGPRSWAPCTAYPSRQGRSRSSTPSPSRGRARWL